MSIKKSDREIIKKQSRYCCACNREMDFSNKYSKDSFTIDHIVPKSLHGSDKLENLTGMCKSCNSKRNNKAGEERIKLIKKRGYILEYEIDFIKYDIKHQLINKEDLEELKKYFTKLYDKNLNIICTL